jgi:hypothetical protein
MEYLVPIVIVTIAIGLVLLFLRRPTVVRPPTNASDPKTNAPTTASTTDDPIREILSELNAGMPPGASKSGSILKGNKQIAWTVTRRLKQTSLTADDLSGESPEQLARDLLAKLAPGSLASDGPPEARLKYPGSSLVVDSFEIQRTTGGSAESRDVYKTTLATEADAGQVLAWYRDWLAGHGWQLSPSAGTNPDSSQEYVRATEHLRLAVADPAALAPILAVPIPVGTKTVYEVEYSNASTPPPAP